MIGQANDLCLCQKTQRQLSITDNSGAQHYTSEQQGKHRRAVFLDLINYENFSGVEKGIWVFLAQLHLWKHPQYTFRCLKGVKQITLLPSDLFLWAKERDCFIDAVGYGNRYDGGCRFPFQGRASMASTLPDIKILYILQESWGGEKSFLY
eukprot:c35520_g1_i1 orf=30-482(+)